MTIFKHTDIWLLWSCTAFRRLYGSLEAKVLLCEMALVEIKARPLYKYRSGVQLYTPTSFPAICRRSVSVANEATKKYLLQVRSNPINHLQKGPNRSEYFQSGNGAAYSWFGMETAVSLPFIYMKWGSWYVPEVLTRSLRMKNTLVCWVRDKTLLLTGFE
jgi:hypothetical protein